MTVTRDATSIAQWLPGSGFDQWTLSGQGGAHSVELNLSDASGQLADASSNVYSNNFAPPADLTQDLSELTHSTSNNSALDLTFANNLSTPVTVNLDFGLGGFDTVALSLGNSVVVPPVDPIPEPATYALMGLGLVGIALARRRQSR